MKMGISLQECSRLVRNYQHHDTFQRVFNICPAKRHRLFSIKHLCYRKANEMANLELLQVLMESAQSWVIMSMTN